MQAYTVRVSLNTIIQRIWDNCSCLRDQITDSSSSSACSYSTGKQGQHCSALESRAEALQTQDHHASLPPTLLLSQCAETETRMMAPMLSQRKSSCWGNLPNLHVEISETYFWQTIYLFFVAVVFSRKALKVNHPFCTININQKLALKKYHSLSITMLQHSHLMQGVNHILNAHACGSADSCTQKDIFSWLRPALQSIVSHGVNQLRHINVQWCQSVSRCQMIMAY